MITIKRTGPDLASVAASLRDIPARVLPYAAATALTRVAKDLATTEIPNAMRAAFDRPTGWTLKSLAIVPANKTNLSAAVFVKNTAAGRGVAQERYLVPNVEGGARSEKRFERALRYSGVISGGDRVYPARALALDAYGNIPAGTVRSVLAWAKTGAARKAKRTKTSAAVNPRGFFLFGKPGGVRGIAIRQGKTIVPQLIISTRQPAYRPRLDYAGISQAYTLQAYPKHLDDAVRRLLARTP